MDVKKTGDTVVKIIFGLLAGGFAAFGLFEAINAQTKATMMIASMITLIGMLALTDCFKKRD